MLKVKLQQKYPRYNTYVGVFCTSVLLFALSINSHAAPSAYDLKIELSPAVCLLDPSQHKQRKCLEGYSFTILGLFPETQRNCVTASAVQLPPLQTQAIARVMPNEYVRQQVWTQVGGCEYGSASQYFRRIINFSQNLKIPNEVRSSQSHHASYQEIQNRFVQINQKLPPNGIRLICQMNRKSKQMLLTQIHICYHANGKYKECTTPVQNTCPSSFTIQGMY